MLTGLENEEEEKNEDSEKIQQNWNLFIQNRKLRFVNVFNICPQRPV